MRIDKQIAIFLDNRPGLLARICEELTKAKINMIALSIADSLDYAIVRLVVDDFAKAEKLIRAIHKDVHVRDVVVFEMENHPGALARIAEQLSNAGINIEYAYATAAESRSTMVLRTNDLEGTVNALS